MSWRPENATRLLVSLLPFALTVISLLAPFTTPFCLCPADFNPPSYYFLAYLLPYFLLSGILIAAGRVVVVLGRRARRDDSAVPQFHNTDAQGHTG